MVQPPMEDGAIEIVGDRVHQVSRWKELTRAEQRGALDLGEVIVLPGLINAHCHLDYTDMAGLLPVPKTFPDWIKSILVLKSHWSFSDYARSWLNGARMLLETGVTTVADIEAVPELLPEVWSATPLRIFSFLEMTGVRSRRPASAIVQEAAEKIQSLPHLFHRGGFSPHAPYSTTPELLAASSSVARAQNLRLAMHVAESAAEFSMFMERRGPLFDWLKDQREVSDCGGVSPVQHLDRHGILSDRFLAAHVNYLACGDAALLANRGASVVHCPRSHVYFGHQEFPQAELENAGVNVCLGTDSLASVRKVGKLPPALNLFLEMQTLATQSPQISAETILRMATINGARALGLAGRVGELSAGAQADLLVLPYVGAAREATTAVVQHQGKVAAAMISGNWAFKNRT